MQPAQLTEKSLTARAVASIIPVLLYFFFAFAPIIALRMHSRAFIKSEGYQRNLNSSSILSTD